MVTSGPAGRGAGLEQEDALNRLVFGIAILPDAEPEQKLPISFLGLEEAEPPVTVKANRES